MRAWAFSLPRHGDLGSPPVPLNRDFRSKGIWDSRPLTYRRVTNPRLGRTKVCSSINFASYLTSPTHRTSQYMVCVYNLLEILPEINYELK